MAALAAQDYPNLSILVIDADSAEEVKPRVARRRPGAFVRRLDEDPGFGAAANEVLEVVDGAAFYLLCHDDVALGARRRAPPRRGGLPLERRRRRAQARRLGRPPPAAPGGRGHGPRRLRRAARRAGRARPGAARRGARRLHGARGLHARAGRPVRRDRRLRRGDQRLPRRREPVLAGPHRRRSRDRRPRRRGPPPRGARAAPVGYDERRRLQARHRLRVGAQLLRRPRPRRGPCCRPSCSTSSRSLYALVAGRTASASATSSTPGRGTCAGSASCGSPASRSSAFRRVPDGEVRRHGRGSARLQPVPPRPDRRGRGPASRGWPAAGATPPACCGRAPPRASVTVWVGGGVRARWPAAATCSPAACRRSASWWPSACRRSTCSRAWASGWRTRRASGPRRRHPTAFGVDRRPRRRASSGRWGCCARSSPSGMIPLGAFVRLPAARARPGPGARRSPACSCTSPVPAALQRPGRRPLGRAGALRRRAAHGRACSPAPAASRRSARVGAGARRVPARSAGAAGCWPSGSSPRWSATILPGRRRHRRGRWPLALASVGVVALEPAGSRSDARRGARRGGRRRPAAPAVEPRLPRCPAPRCRRFTGVARAGPAVATCAALLRFEVGPLGGAPLGWCFLVAAALPLLIGRAERHAWAVRGWTLAVVSFGAGLGRPARHAARSRSRPSTCCSCPRPSGWPSPPPWAWPPSRSTCPATGSAGGRSRRAWRPRPSSLGIVPVLGAVLRRALVDAGRRPRPGARLHRRRERRRRRSACSGSATRPRCPLGGWALDDGLAYATTDDGTPDAREPVGGLRRRPPPGCWPTPSTWPARARPPASAGSSRRWACATSSCPSGWRPPRSPTPSSPCRRRSAPPWRRSSTSSRSTCPPG